MPVYTPVTGLKFGRERSSDMLTPINALVEVYIQRYLLAKVSFDPLWLV